MENIIEFKNICKNFADNQILKNINLSIPKGKTFGIIGESGAGKSTLLRLINLLERPTTGNISVDGKDIVNLSNKHLLELRHKIGMIFQNFNLMSNRTVAQNIALPLEFLKTNKKDIQSKVKSLLKIVNLESKANQYPHQLSGGQKQRVGIARALANDPDILLCDEATSALDPHNTNSILNLIKNIQQQSHFTVVLITHEMETLQKICDYVAVIDKGSIVEQNTIQNIINNPQHKITKKLLSTSIINSNLTYQIANKENLLIKLHLNQDTSYEEIIKILTNKFRICPQLISADLQYKNQYTSGIAVIEIPNNTEITSFLSQHNIQLEVIG